jgi:hypothetical protein
MAVGPVDLGCTLRDRGVGLFESIRSKCGLGDETEALRDLLKGKRTTLPERHSGEGIFFSSKAADRIAFRSHRIRLVLDNKKDNTLVERRPHIEGTRVHFELARRSKRDLNEIFERHAPAKYDFSFERTRVRVALHAEEFVSRSEARRLLSRLGEFREAILDFKGVERIGQGFADEIFRVFPRRHPDTEIRAVNAIPEVDAMIQHVREPG